MSEQQQARRLLAEYGDTSLKSGHCILAAFLLECLRDLDADL
eukprot:CAMPEP_0181176960 /NCGR_PEP_ID=MMETSP1096-20121128/4905_1 /TAXON_ID=156174 ORGANISM="Chrysochromulina ericina, Strain CCMP281" /NCGR_SAMPLE_ID=MMETSP1096 /ASSEMBLY_ACC=CAM_ASM_000453 /LENGTH=41 /DNA_ID= /DNA_START= /DNA_END= /DNA_ORIENTATION=